MARKNSPWTPERLQKLRTLWARHLTPGQIAQALHNTSRHAVRWQLIMLGLIEGSPRKDRRRPVHRGVALVDLQTSDCRFPLWSDTERPSGMFCGKPKKLGSSYCEAHHKRAHVPFRQHRISKPLEERMIYVKKR